jgi:hypothetical protein
VYSAVGCYVCHCIRHCYCWLGQCSVADTSNMLLLLLTCVLPCVKHKQQVVVGVVCCCTVMFNSVKSVVQVGELVTLLIASILCVALHINYMCTLTPLCIGSCVMHLYIYDVTMHYAYNVKLRTRLHTPELMQCIWCIEYSASINSTIPLTSLLQYLQLYQLLL